MTAFSFSCRVRQVAFFLGARLDSGSRGRRVRALNGQTLELSFFFFGRPARGWSLPGRRARSPSFSPFRPMRAHPPCLWFRVATRVWPFFFFFFWPRVDVHAPFSSCIVLVAVVVGRTPGTDSPCRASGRAGGQEVFFPRERGVLQCFPFGRVGRYFFFLAGKPPRPVPVLMRCRLPAAV